MWRLFSYEKHFGSSAPFSRSLSFKVLCCLVEPIAAVIPSLSIFALIDLLQELQGSDGQLETILHNKV